MLITPVSRRHRPYVDLRLAHRLRHWPNINATLGQWLYLAYCCGEPYIPAYHNLPHCQLIMPLRLPQETTSRACGPRRKPEKPHLNPNNPDIFVHKPWRPKGFFNLKSL